MKYLLILISFIFAIGCEFSIAQDNISEESSRPNMETHSTNDQNLSNKEKYDLLYEASKDIHNGYNIDVMKSLALLIIGIGWFVTSDKSREFFTKSRAARKSAVIAAVVLCAVHVWSSISTYLLSREKTSLLSALKYVDPKYYRNHEITAAALVLNLALIIALFGVLIVILCSLKETARKSE